jgi:branched-chain amino acid transport system permease protein
MLTFVTSLAGGLVVASLYITYGLGLAIVYRVSGVLNFAHGAIGTVAGYLLFALLARSWPYAAAALVGIVGGTLVAVAIQTLIVRQLPSHSAEVVGIATLGVLIVIEGVLLGLFGGEGFPLPYMVPTQSLFSVGAYRVQTTTLLSIGVAAAATVGLALLLYRTKLGLAIRAVSEGDKTSAMMGINPDFARAVVWGIGGALSGVAAFLIVPSNYLTPDFLTTYLIATFVAVVLGGFEQLLGVVIGGIVFGIVQSMFSVYVTGRLTSTVSFFVILIVLIFLPYGVLGRALPRVPEPRFPRSGSTIVRRFIPLSRPPRDSSPARRLRLPTLRGHQVHLAIPVLMVIGAVLVGFLLDDSWLAIGTSVAALFLAVLGVDLIFGYSGQLSIGQSGFMLMGGYGVVLLQSKLGVPFLAALAIATLAGAVGGFVFGLPAARLRGVYLAVLTLAFALAVPEVVSFFSSVTGGDTGIGAKVPSWLDGDQRNLLVYFFAVVLAGLGATAVLWLARSQPGRVWRAVRDSDVAAAATGINVTTARVSAFATGSALCALSGGVLATSTGYLSPGSFSLWTSIYLIVAVVVGGRTSTFGALLGAAFVVIVPYESSSIPALTNLLLGILLIVVLLLRPDGIRGLIADVAGIVAGIGRRPYTGGGPSDSDQRTVSAMLTTRQQETKP